MSDQRRSDERVAEDNVNIDQTISHSAATNSSVEPENRPPVEVSSGRSSETAKSKPACGVCGVNLPKYKCPRCYMPYCSIACNKEHRENHPPDPEPTAPANPPKPSTAAESIPGTTSPASSHPFQSLESSEQLRMLFRKYPGLRDQLDRIYETTLPPKTDSVGIPASLMQGVAKKETWNHDMGIQNGKAALRKARTAQGEDGEAIREYYELVSHVMNQASAQHGAASLLQQQTAQQDTQLIQRLMAHEER